MPRPTGPALTCPWCPHPLPGYGRGFHTGACAGCGTNYSVALGKLLSAKSDRIVLERASTYRAGQYVFHHLFTIYDGRRAVMFSYKVTRDGAGQPFSTNMEVAFVFAVSGENRVHGYMSLAHGGGPRFVLPEDAEFKAQAISDNADTGARAVDHRALAAPQPPPTELPVLQSGSSAPVLGAPVGVADAAAPTSPLLCPSCGKPFLDVSHDGYVETACGACATAYAVATGNLSKPTSTRIVLQRQGTKQIGIYKYFHQFSVFIPGGFKSFSYATRTPVGGVLFSKDTRASVVCTRLGIEIQDIVYVYSHLVNQRLDVAAVGAKARRDAGTAAILLFVVSAVVAGFLGASFGTSLAAGAIIGAAVGALVFRARFPRARLSAREVALAEARRRLLELRAEAVTKLRVLLESHRRIQERIGRLHAHEMKMARVDPELYRARIERSQQAKASLHEVLQRDQPLLAAYSRMSDMTGLELEAEQLDGVASESPYAEVFAHADELRRLEASVQNLRIDVEAAEEVEAELATPDPMRRCSSPEVAERDRLARRVAAQNSLSSEVCGRILEGSRVQRVRRHTR